MGLQNSEMRDARCEMGGCGAASRIPHPASRYSYLSASTGSSRAARLAGYSPNPTPVRADAPSAATMDHSGTWAGIGVSRETPKASRPPASIPTAPPTRVRVEASTRNCHRIARRVAPSALRTPRSEEHTSELQSLAYLVCRLLLEKKKKDKDAKRPRPSLLVSLSGP